MKPVSKTAFYCCGARMQDAAKPHPLVGDDYAQLFFTGDALDYWHRFEKFKAPNASNVARHYIIDKQVAALLQEKPGTTVLLIGAGFDSRAFRLKGGNYIEVDEPALIQYKNEKLPAANAPNPLQRVAIDFEHETLKNVLQPFATTETVIIILEGVLMYLDAAAKQDLLNTLTTLFPQHDLFCDIMSKAFFDKLGGPIHDEFAKSGSAFKDLRTVPEEMFLQQGYTLISKTSNILAACEAGIFPAPAFLVKLFMRRLAYGYSVYHFVMAKKMH